MKLPNPDKAIIPSAKLEGYSLNLEHSEGRHKAIVFRSALGMGLAEAPELRSALRDVLKNQAALATDRNAYGQKYQIDFKMTRMNRSAVVRSVWIVRNEEAFPRLVTCYIL